MPRNFFLGLFPICLLCFHLCPSTEKRSSEQTVGWLILPHWLKLH